MFFLIGTTFHLFSVYQCSNVTCFLLALCQHVLAFSFHLRIIFSPHAERHSTGQLAAYMFLITGLFMEPGDIITYGGHKKIISN